MLRFDLADRYYKQALAIDPNSVPTLNNVGYSHLRRSEEGYGAEFLASAKAYFERAQAMAGDNTVIQKNLARVTADLATPEEPDAVSVANVPGFQVAARDPYASWIERRSQNEVYLVTDPDAAIVALVRSLGLRPDISALSARITTIGAQVHSALPQTASTSRPTVEANEGRDCGPRFCFKVPPSDARFLHESSPVSAGIVSVEGSHLASVNAPSLIAFRDDYLR